MNWLKTNFAQDENIKSKPMALPVDVQDSRWNKGGIDRIDRAMTEEVAEEEKSQYPDISYLGAGTEGIAVDLGDGKVGKYTDKENEARFAKRMIKEHLPGIIEIYDVRQLQRGLWVVIMDRVIALDEIHPMLVAVVNEVAMDTRLHVAEGFPKEGAFPDIRLVINRNEQFLPRREIISIYEDTVDLIKKLWSNGISIRDLHGGNVGYTAQGELVLFDFGYV